MDPTRTDAQVMRAAAGQMLQHRSAFLLAVAGWLDAVAAEAELGEPGTTSEARERSSAAAVARYWLAIPDEVAA
jgi:hypothetical protein